uniref:PadR family transcriptional regulator n=1 Tax=Thermosporothrix sp. COM3 TaxID=2490863 RepID=A0A455SG49_9CHLR|nr:hypothetical protein KTC_07330 [Thermosporothrix sp. COM3]
MKEMERPEAYPITYGVLGLLAFCGPMTGYDLKRMFDHILSPMWGATQSQIYKELKRMQELGWVEMQREEQESRPDRKIYSMTEAGREALAHWQTQPPTFFQLRDELLLKLLFGSFGSPEALLANIREGIRFHEQRLLAHRQNASLIPPANQPHQPSGRPDPYAAPAEPDIYFRLITRFAIALEKTYLNWLQEAQATIEQEQED